MKFVFCSDPLDPTRVEEDFADEYSAARNAGFDTTLLDFDRIKDGRDASITTRRIPVSDCVVKAMYRGWMLTPDEYRLLYDVLWKKNIRLINSPEQYEATHCLPAYYSLIENSTPESVWLHPTESQDIRHLMKVLELFHGDAVIVKDYVKSCKHAWDDACYIPDSSSQSEVARVVAGFLERQGEDLNGNLVFRRYHKFEPIGVHPKSGLNLTREYRLFVYGGEVAGCFPYWSKVDYDGISPPVSALQSLIQQIGSTFFTMDIARTVDGEWMIVELGDGQVSGFPDIEAIRKFYGWLKANSQ